MSEPDKNQKPKHQNLDREKIIGLRVKTYREIMGMSQTELGEAIGVTYQQIQKYETGRNKISASRLNDIAETLKTTAATIMAGLDKAHMPETMGVSDIDRAPIIQETERDKESAEILKIFYSVNNEVDRQEMLDVLRSIAKAKKKR
jgi:transcriptional regulator with XRE-family HTH domain